MCLCPISEQSSEHLSSRTVLSVFSCVILGILLNPIFPSGKWTSRLDDFRVSLTFCDYDLWTTFRMCDITISNTYSKHSEIWNVQSLVIFSPVQVLQMTHLIFKAHYYTYDEYHILPKWPPSHAEKQLENWIKELRINVDMLYLSAVISVFDKDRIKSDSMHKY